MASAPERLITPAVFANVVKQRLGPVLARTGFPSADSAEFVEAFQRGPVRVVARYGGYREGLSVSIARDDDERPLELSEALSVTDCPPADVWRVAQMMTVDADALDRLLTTAAVLLARHGMAFLDGDRAVWAQAHAERAARQTEYNRRTAVSSFVIESAATAWHDHDYARVRDLLAPVRQYLDRTQRRRLDFAERHLNDRT